MMMLMLSLKIFKREACIDKNEYWYN